MSIAQKNRQANKRMTTWSQHTCVTLASHSL
jgi:hypothetical protein